MPGVAAVGTDIHAHYAAPAAAPRKALNSHCGIIRAQLEPGRRLRDGAVDGQLL